MPILAALLLFQAGGFDGHWLGTLQAGPGKLRLALHLNRDAGGNFSATLDSLDQGAMAIPVNRVEVQARRIVFEILKLGVKFEGALSADGKQIAGTFQQMGASLPLSFERTEKPAQLKRPQDPQKPYPYDEHEVLYENRAAGIRLAGTLTVPRAPGPHPAVLLITGSGAQDRNETVAGHRPFLVLADFLTRRGIAVLRADDRGMGGSGGDINGGTSEDFAGDALAGVGFLKSRKEIDARRIGLIGHSEGGLIAPMAAGRGADVAFIVLLAGTGVNGERVVLSQIEQLSKAAGRPAEAIAQTLAQQQKLFDVLRAEKDNGVALKRMQELVAGAPEAERKRIAAGLNAMVTPWYRAFLAYEPRQYLSRVKVPVLAVNGELDTQVVPRINLPAIAAALEEGGNRDYTIVKLPGLNHLFQRAKTGSPGEYATIEETIAPSALETIAAWIAAHVR